MLKNYLIIAFKVLLRRKFFTFISLFGISFTLMVLMVATAFLDHIFSPMAPEIYGDRTLMVTRVSMTSPDGNNNWNMAAGYKLLDRYIRPLKEKTEGAIDRMSFFTNQIGVTTYKNSEKIEFQLKRADGEYWNIMAFEFLEGQGFTAQDEANANFVVVINEAMRNKFFKGENALGKTIEFDGQAFRVVGVVRNVPQTRDAAFADVWAPISTDKSPSYKEQLMGDFVAAILARSSDDFPHIKTAFAGALLQVEFPDPKEFNKISASPDTAFERVAKGIFWDSDTTKDKSGQMRVLIGICMLFFMMLPTINLININVSRIMERASEIGVRKAFGASSTTLVGQFVIENIFLTVVGGIAGLGLSIFALQYINSSGVIDYADFQLNYRIFIYGMLLSVFFGLLSGVYPAWKMSKVQPVEALKGGAK